MVRCANRLCRREIADNLLGTLETIFRGRRQRNDFNILRSMGNSSPTITVSHLVGGREMWQKSAFFCVLSSESILAFDYFALPKSKISHQNDISLQCAWKATIFETVKIEQTGRRKNLFEKNLPGDHNNKVHHVPHVSQIASSVEDQSHCQDFERSLHGENDQKVLLRFFLN